MGRVVGDYVRDTPWTWIAAETVHFVGLSMLVGVILLIDLRVLGFMKQVSFAALDRLLPWAMLGFAINTFTGMLFFAAAYGQYTNNPAFFWKLIFVLLAGANTPVLHIRSHVGAGARTRRTDAVEGRGRRRHVLLGRRDVLGQHAAVYRERLLSVGEVNRRCSSR